MSFLDDGTPPPISTNTQNFTEGKLLLRLVVYLASSAKGSKNIVYAAKKSSRDQANCAVTNDFLPEQFRKELEIAGLTGAQAMATTLDTKTMLAVANKMHH